MNYRRGNEDFFNLSKALDNYLEVKVDVEALGVLADTSNMDPLSANLSDAQFLYSKRIMAETALIKSTIIYKCHSNTELSGLEQKYATKWIDAAKEAKTLVTGESVMLPELPAKLRISDLSPEDLYTFNSLPGVSFTRESHGGYALNDLVLELGHLVDRDTIRKVELKMLEEKLKKKFSIKEGFSLVEKRNKEIDMLHEELEEVQWRRASMIDDKERSVIKEILGLGRGVDNFDKVFWNLDQKSFEAFMDEANTFDNRTTLLENWICRKEEEFKNRVNLPTPELNKSD